MTKRRRWLLIVVALSVMALLASGVVEHMEEMKSQLSLKLTDEAGQPDRVRISVTITSVNPGTRQLTAQLGFLPMGLLARDVAIPRVNLKLLVNNSQGPREFMFSAGERMDRIEVTFPLDGELTLYPFDKYETTIRLFMETPPPTRKPAASPLPEAAQEQSGVTPEPDDVVVEAAAQQSSTAVPLSLYLSAAIPQIRLMGEVARSDISKIPVIRLHLSRPDNVINLSIAAMVMMLSISLAVLVMTIKAAAQTGPFDALPISLAVALIFGLPALRGIQAGVPPVGVLGDYFSFVWAEIFVVAAANIAAVTWLFRSNPKKRSDSK